MKRQNLLGSQRLLMVAGLAKMAEAGATLLLLPFVVTNLSKAEAGLWFAFVAAQGLVLLADFGFQPTLARNISLAWSGVKSIDRKGLGNHERGEPNLFLAAELLAVSRRLYMYLGAGVLAVLLTAGNLWIHHLASQAGIDLREAILAWMIFSIALAMNIYFSWVPSFLAGSGAMEENYIYIVITRITQPLLGIIALISGGGLEVLALMFLIGGALSRVSAGFLLRRKISQLPKVGVSIRPELMATIRYNASRMGLLALSGFLITRSNLFVTSAFVGVTESASYAISLQLLNALATVSQLPLQIALPRLVAARLDQDGHFLRKTAFKTSAALVGIFGLGVLTLIFVGKPLLQMIGSNVLLMATPTFLLLALITLLEANHANFAFLISTGNEQPFVKAGVITAAIVVAGSIIVTIIGGGVLGVILFQGLTQLAYNNWKWPLVALRDMRRLP